MEEIKQDIKEIRKDVVEIKETLAKNTASLEFHVLRTNQVESRIEKVEFYILGLLGSGILALLAKLFS